MLQYLMVAQMLQNCCWTGEQKSRPLQWWYLEVICIEVVNMQLWCRMDALLCILHHIAVTQRWFQYFWPKEREQMWLIRFPIQIDKECQYSWAAILPRADPLLSILPPVKGMLLLSHYCWTEEPNQTLLMRWWFSWTITVIKYILFCGRFVGSWNFDDFCTYLYVVSISIRLLYRKNCSFKRESIFFCRKERLPCNLHVTVDTSTQ